MPFKGKRYPEVEGKTVEHIETNDEEGLMTVHVRFTDTTALSIGFDSKLLLPIGWPILRNYTADEGRPLEPACRSRTQTTFRCCASQGRGGERRRKRPGSEIRVR